MRVLYRDELVLAVDKPAGMLTVPGRGPREEEALSAQVRATAPGALPVHRLDRDTSGVVIFGLTKEAHRALNAAFESRRAAQAQVCRPACWRPGPPRVERALGEGPRGLLADAYVCYQ